MRSHEVQEKVINRYALSLIKNRELGLFPVNFSSGRSPLLFSGNWPQINSYAQKHGWDWKHDKSIFGGYWVNKEGKAYEIDLV